MFDRARHQHIENVLSGLNHGMLDETKCFFGGGTAIAMLAGEYRLSQDIDFLCADLGRYRHLRRFVGDCGPQALLGPDVKLLKEPRADQYGIRMLLDSESGPLKFEIVLEGRIPLHGTDHRIGGCRTLSVKDLYAEKLLANADRGLDRSAQYKDILDLMILELHYPELSWVEPRARAQAAYGAAAERAYHKAFEFLRSHPEAFHEATRVMEIDPRSSERLSAMIGYVPVSKYEGPSHAP